MEQERKRLPKALIPEHAECYVQKTVLCIIMFILQFFVLHVMHAPMRMTGEGGGEGGGGGGGECLGDETI